MHQSVLASEVLYGPAIGAVKISTLLLFARIFPDRNFKRALWAIGIFLSIYTAILAIAAIFQCRPISGAWDPTIKADCIQIKLVLMSIGGLNVLTDLFLLIAPLPQLWKLHIRNDTKYQLIGIFSIGGLSVNRPPDNCLADSIPTAPPLSPSTASQSSTTYPFSTQPGPIATLPFGPSSRSALPFYARPPLLTVLCSIGLSAFGPCPSVPRAEARGRAVRRFRTKVVGSWG